MQNQTIPSKHQPESSPANNIFSDFNKIEQALVKQQVPEKKVEKVIEKEAAEKQYNKVDVDHPEQSPYVIKSAKPVDDQVLPTKSKTLSDIEYMLSEDLDLFYNSLDENRKKQFRDVGEQIAIEIDNMVKGFKTAAKRIVMLIRKWLMLVPGMNKFFLEQEAKIKTQKIMEYAREYNKKNKYKY